MSTNSTPEQDQDFVADFMVFGVSERQIVEGLGPDVKFTMLATGDNGVFVTENHFHMLLSYVRCELPPELSIRMRPEHEFTKNEKQSLMETFAAGSIAWAAAASDEGYHDEDFRQSVYDILEQQPELQQLLLKPAE